MRKVMIEKTLYEFKELPQKGKDSVIKTYVENWSGEWALDEAKTRAQYLGIDIDDFHYSGFCSQGDGASFTGWFRAKDVTEKGLAAVASYEDETLDALSAAIKKVVAALPNLRVEITTSGRYCHSNTMRFDYAENNEDIDIDGELARRIERVLKTFADQVYNTLRKDYFASTEESFVEMDCTEQELEFFVDGSVYVEDSE